MQENVGVWSWGLASLTWWTRVSHLTSQTFMSSRDRQVGVRLLFHRCLPSTQQSTDPVTGALERSSSSLVVLVADFPIKGLVFYRVAF